MTDTPAHRLVTALRNTAQSYAAGDQIAPCAVLWADPDTSMGIGHPGVAGAAAGVLPSWQLFPGETYWAGAMAALCRGPGY